MMKQNKTKRGRPELESKEDKSVGRTIYLKVKYWEIIDDLRGEDSSSRWVLDRLKELLAKQAKAKAKRDANLL